VVSDQGRRDAYGDLLPLFVDDDGGMIIDRLAGLHGPLHGAVGLAGAGPEDIEAVLVNRLREGETRDLFGGAVEEGIDPAVKVHGEHAVRHALQDDATGETVVPAPVRSRHQGKFPVLLPIPFRHLPAVIP